LTKIFRATGLPAPGYEWYKNGTYIKNNPDYQESVEDGLAKLCISETFSDDTAKFTCRAYNVAGDAQVHATLTVKGICTDKSVFF
jgi:Immunoglobulin I-set domain